MFRFILIAILLFFSLRGDCQKPKRLNPKIGGDIKFSRESQLKWKALLKKYEKLETGIQKYDELTKQEKVMVDSLEDGRGPNTLGGGCNWYECTGLYKIRASSHLRSDKWVNYIPDNISDFNLFTAWIPDTTKSSVGENISFYFKPNTARVTTIIIYNGYNKNTEIYNDNGRVKSLKLFINNKLYAILNLSDTTAAQFFSVPPLRNKIKDLELKFEIASVYPGAKFKEVAISEINFDGIDCH